MIEILDPPASASKTAANPRKPAARPSTKAKPGKPKPRPNKAPAGARYFTLAPEPGSWPEILPNRIRFGTDVSVRLYAEEAAAGALLGQHLPKLAARGGDYALVVYEGGSAVLLATRPIAPESTAGRMAEERLAKQLLPALAEGLIRGADCDVFLSPGWATRVGNLIPI